MHAIEDRSGYLELMKSSLDDKLFFLDSEEVNQASIFVDFGCADGALSRQIAKELPGALVIGYDSDEEMVRIARSHPSNSRNLVYTSDWEYVKQRIYETDDRISAIILSSVLHEVASDRSKLNKLFRDINGMGFDYIIIRDMLIHPSVDSSGIPDALRSKLKELAETNEEFKKQLDSFYAYDTDGLRYRTSYKDAIHFLLKMDYKNNWDRENEENYLSLYYPDFTDLPYLYDYTFVHFEHYMLPYLKKHWKDVLGMDIDVPTHVKVILKRLSE